MTTPRERTGNEIAIVGMACRFPGAASPEALWDRLAAGADCITTFGDEDLAAAGVPPEEFARDDYVRRAGIVGDIAGFDTAPFGLGAREAALLDPQQRLFLECAWEALERAALDPQHFGGPVAVFAGAGLPHYLYRHVLPTCDPRQIAATYQALLGNDKDYLSTRTAYLLGLTGPAVTVQTACSTSLVAVHMACQSLLGGECDAALAGGVSLQVPQTQGFRYGEGMILSPDGICRAFDADANGTVIGSGAGAVVLRRLDDALADGDPVAAVLLGSAINNDGAHKVGFTAPGVAGQTAAIAEALAVAGVPPASIGYVEAHGTGTPLGDPIEVEALTQAFASDPPTPGACRLGSIKTNLGHLDTAAGVAGLLKAVLSLQHRQVPPSLHFTQPNPKIPFDRTPFRVADRLSDWADPGHPRRAGVSAFGMGGTNAHAVLEEAPAAAGAPAPHRRRHLFLLSAADPAALHEMRTRLAADLGRDDAPPPATVARTLGTGRRALAYRAGVVADDNADATARLAAGAPPAHRIGDAALRVAFLLPGQGAQHPGMARDLYATEPVFRETLDRCLGALPEEAEALRALLLADAPTPDDAARLAETRLAQPAIFATTMGVAALWQAWGVRPALLLGHSLGELSAACIAGVFALEDAARLVRDRAAAMQAMPPGAMLAVPLDADALAGRLGDDLHLAALNGPALTTVSGREAAIARFEAELRRDGVDAKRLRTSHAFHSPLMADAAARFGERVAAVARHAPAVPIVSNRTGALLDAEAATDPAAWAAQLLEPVRFAAGLATVLDADGTILLDTGPGETLARLSRAHPDARRAAAIVTSLPHGGDATPADRVLLDAAGRLWTAGVDLDRGALFGAGPRAVLPTYPFQRKRYWIDAPDADAGGTDAAAARTADARLPLERWAATPTWTRIDPGPVDESGGTVLLVGNGDAWTDALGEALADGGARIVRAVAGDAPAGPDAAGLQCVDDASRAGWRRTLEAITERDGPVRRIVYATATGPDATPATLAELVALLQAAADRNEPAAVTVLTRGACDVTGDEPLRPDAAALTGPVLVAPQETPRLACRLLDLSADAGGDPRAEAEAVVRFLNGTEATTAVTALRGRTLWTPDWRALPLPAADLRLRPDGVVLITGGLGRVGLALARALATAAPCRIVLASRSGLPPAETWDRVLAEPATPAGTRQRIEAIRALRDAPGTVRAEALDVTDPAAVAALVARLDSEGAGLCGVIHAAGESGPSLRRPLADLTPALLEAQQAPKRDGAEALATALADRKVDFVLLTGSLAAVLGGPGFAAYAAANAALDAVALREARRGGTRWVSAALDAWRFAEDEALAERSELLARAMAPEEGAEAIGRIVAAGRSGRVAISTTALAARLRQWTRPAETAPDATGADPTAEHDRPDLSTPFRAPETETERAICSLLEDLLGVAPVGLDDDFFELGGHSLLASQALSRLRSTFDAPVPLRALFEEPTAAGMAAAVAAARLAAASTAPGPDGPDRVEIEL